MKEKIIYIDDISDAMQDGWDSPDLDFSNYEKLSRKIDYELMDLSRKLRAGIIDSLSYYKSNQLFVWSRSLKKSDAIQITSFQVLPNGDLIPNADQQITTYIELLHECAPIYSGAELHLFSV